MKTFYPFILFLVSTLTFQAQQAKWISDKDMNDFEITNQVLYVPSATSPFVVNSLEKDFPSQPNGPVMDPEHYIVAHDTSGNELWTQQITGNSMYPNPLAILSKSNDRFWIVAAGGSYISIGSQNVPSAYGNNYISYLFVEMNRAGTVTNYFSYGIPDTIFSTVGSFAFDKHGNFVFSGMLMATNLYANTPFSFANYGGLLIPFNRKLFVARISPNGTPLNFFQFDNLLSPSSTFLDYSWIDNMATNTNDGSIVFCGTLGDTLAIANNTLINTTSNRQLFLCQLDSNFNCVSAKSETVSPYGSLINILKYNRSTNAFYFASPWGDTLYYGPNPILPSPTSTGQNYFIAKLRSNSLNLDTIVPVENVYLGDFTFLSDGSFCTVGAIADSAIRWGNTVYRPFNPARGNFSFLARMQPRLGLDTILFSGSSSPAISSSRFNCVDHSDDDKSFYAGGFNQGNMSIGNKTVNSGFRLDAIVTRIDRDETATASFLASGSNLCKGSTLSTTNTSAGRPVPTYSWSANPSTGVSFLPNSVTASPNISFSYAGSFTITCVASNSLGSNYSNKTLLVSNCLGIEGQQSISNLINVQPNPSSGYFALSASGTFHEETALDMTVLNTLGETVLHATDIRIQNKAYFINLTGQPNGVYFIHLKLGNDQLTKKVVVFK